MGKGDKGKDKMIAALTKTLGIVTEAAKIAGISRNTHYKWIASDEEYKRRVEEIDDMTLDFVESKLLQQIKEGDPGQTRFYLKTKGKKRGYVERQEVDHSGELKTINIEIVK